MRPCTVEQEVQPATLQEGGGEPSPFSVKGLLNGLRQDLVRRRQDRIARKNLNYQMKYDVSGWLDARSYEGMEMVGNRYFKRLFE